MLENTLDLATEVNSYLLLLSVPGIIEVAEGSLLANHVQAPDLRYGHRSSVPISSCSWEKMS